MTRRLLALAWLGLVACGGAPVGPVTTPPPPASTVPVVPPAPEDGRTAAQRFEAALAEVETHDRARDWPTACGALVTSPLAPLAGPLAARFRDASSRAEAETKKPLAVALYDAALVDLRCRQRAAARVDLGAALAADPSLAPAAIALAELDVEERGAAALDAAIATLDAVVVSAQYRDVTALLALARVQIRRAKTQTDTVPSTCHQGSAIADDLGCARQNLRRALAVDASSVEAMSLLALSYLKQSDRGEGKPRDAAALELGLLTVRLGLKKDAAYAPLHNTAGLLLLAKDDGLGALAAFARACVLDPDLLDAQENFGALSLQARDFGHAADAYRRATALAPDDYEAHLGLASSLRGQLTSDNAAALGPTVRAELDVCERLLPERADAYYEDGLFLHRQAMLLQTGPRDDTFARLHLAVTRFEKFISLAGAKPELAPLVRRAREHVTDINDVEVFLRGHPGPTSGP